MKAPWPEGKERTDKDGVTYWITFANERPIERPEPAEKPQKQAAPPQVLDRVYRKLLEELGLAQEHREWLLARGHSAEGIERREYRTMPRERAQAARKLIEAFGEHVCAQVPGLYLATSKDGGKFWSLAGAQGILIPCRDTAGRIVALKVRSNQAGPNRYTYVSSKKYEGASPGRQAHMPLHAAGRLRKDASPPAAPTQPEDRAARSGQPGSSPSPGDGAPTTAPPPVESRTGGQGRTIRVTEGELKADLATELSETLTISVPGVDAWQLALPLLTELGCARVLLAFDADFRSNPRVLRNLLDAASAYAEHCQVEIETWEGEKGIDELLHAGGTPETVSAADFRRAQKPLPAIVCNNRNLPDVTADVLRALKAANEPPVLFQRGDRLVRVRTEEGASVLDSVNDSALRGFAARAASFVEQAKNGAESTVFPPMDVIKDIQALPAWPFPQLERVLNSPIFLPDGSLLDAQGYHPALRVYFAGRSGWAVPRQPSAAQVAQAKALLVNELVGDFPFVSDADRTHTVAAIILPFVREMIDGPTPLHLISAPSAGTGKSLLADAICYPGMGGEALTITASREGEEWRKTLTAALETAPPFILIDNIAARLDSQDLASATTQPVWHDRRLGSSTMVRIPVVSGWLATANNPTLSDEVARRTVPIFLDAQLDEPWERQPEGGFRHENLKLWARANRDRLITACLTLVQNWLTLGRPPCKTRLGSYESWAEVVGGILEAAGFTGFLTGQARLFSRTADQMAEWKAFLSSWWFRWREEEVSLRELYDQCWKNDLLLGVINGKTERGMITALAIALRKQAERQIGGFRIQVLGKDRKGAPCYQLERTGLPLPEPIEPPAQEPDLPDFYELAKLTT